ncbi:MAG: hypothetical protein GY930_02695, partial [bacterium]|nr:hypothetical protein [bacterium]
AEYDFDTEKMTLWEVDSKSHKPTIINNELSRISLARRQRKQHAFSDGSRSHQDAGSGVAGYARLVSAYVSLEGKGLLHLVERDIYHGTKLYLEKPSGPFSKLTRLLDLRQRNKKPVIWAGDPSDGTAWFADFSQKDWRYVALELPENDRFEEWLKPNPGAGSRIAKEISGHEPHDNMFRLAFMKTTGGIAYVDRDTKQVARLPEEQMKQVAAMRATPTIPLLHVAEPGLLFRKSEVRSPDGEVLFTYDFSPSTPAELWRACLTAIGSAMHPPILAPKAFGNITHMQMGSSPYSPDGLDPLRDPIRYISLQALIISRLTWTGFSPWSLIAWVLLLVLAYRIRIRLIKLRATGPRLWLWPLAVIAFGPLGYILCLAMEPKRAFYPVSKTAADRKTVSISSPA